MGRGIRDKLRLSRFSAGASGRELTTSGELTTSVEPQYDVYIQDTVSGERTPALNNYKSASNHAFDSQDVEFVLSTDKLFKSQTPMSIVLVEKRMIKGELNEIVILSDPINGDTKDSRAIELNYSLKKFQEKRDSFRKNSLGMKVQTDSLHDGRLKISLVEVLAGKPPKESKNKNGFYDDHYYKEGLYCRLISEAYFDPKEPGATAKASEFVFEAKREIEKHEDSLAEQALQQAFSLEQKQSELIETKSLRELVTSIS